MRFLFLYTEIAEYFLACCNELSKQGEVHIIRWPVNKEAPFQFQFDKKLKLYSKTDYDFDGLKKLVSSINPDVIICSGWIDKDYLKLVKPFFKKIPTVMSCDTHWTGSLKQRLATIISRFTLMRIFSHAWVPGDIQKQYVLNLGFKPSRIQTGFYSCDFNHFAQIYEAQKTQKEILFPKRFLYVGRYYEFKGIQELWQAFSELQKENPNDWELWCLGVGDIKPLEHPKIKHFGFVQPKDLKNYTSQTGVFILPSRFEPWGVVVHEFASSGFPLLLSNAVGAKNQFLEENKNGFSFQANDVNSIKKAMQLIMNKTHKELVEMSQLSHQKGQSITPEKWANNLVKLIS